MIIDSVPSVIDVGKAPLRSISRRAPEKKDARNTGGLRDGHIDAMAEALRIVLDVYPAKLRIVAPGCKSIAKRLRLADTCSVTLLLDYPDGKI